MLGDDVFIELVRTNQIRFVRYDRWFGYAGNGAGLLFFQVRDNPDAPMQQPHLGLAYSAPLDQAVATVLDATDPTLGAARRAQLSNLLIDNTMPLPVGSIESTLKHETYRDILDSSQLRDVFAIRNAGRSMDRLVGIGPNQLTFHLPHEDHLPSAKPEITSVLRVAFENFQLGIATAVSSSVVTGGDGLLAILRAKGQRIGASIEGDRAFTTMQQIAAVPDIGQAFAQGQLMAEDLLRLRESRHAQAFRDWLGSAPSTESSAEAVGRFAQALNPTGSFPIKVFRFAVTTALNVLSNIAAPGVPGTAVGIAVDALDTFYVDRWGQRGSPRLFLEEARVRMNRAIRQPHRMRGVDRNQPCPCGSGKKFKRCCGR